jgi:hypothetical protein
VYRGVLELDVVLWHEEESGPEGGGKTGKSGRSGKSGKRSGEEGKAVSEAASVKATGVEEDDIRCIGKRVRSNRPVKGATVLKGRRLCPRNDHGSISATCCLANNKRLELLT